MVRGGDYCDTRWDELGHGGMRVEVSLGIVVVIVWL